MNTDRAKRTHKPLAAAWTVRLPDAPVQESEIIVDFRGRGHGRPGVRRSGALHDGNRRRQPLDAVYLRLLHPVQEPPRIRRKALDVPALPFRVQGIELSLAHVDKILICNSGL